MPQLEQIRRFAAIVVLLSVTFGLGACRDREIRSYRTPKEAEDTVAPQTPGPAVDPVVASPSAPHWQKPAAWQLQTASGMRLASFLVSDGKGETADISVVNFGGSGGDELANVNRWRDQLKLAPVAAETLPSQIESLSSGTGNFSIADLTAVQAEAGKQPSRILGAWLRRGNRVWFFKMMGPADLVGSQKAAFVEFLGSLTFAGPVVPTSRGAAAANTNDLPKDAAMAPDLSVLPGTPTLPNGQSLKSAEGSSLRWNAPPSWTVKAGSAMRKGSYSLGPGGAVDVSVTAFPGDVGGPIANVNRWLGQVGLPPIEEGELPRYVSHLDANGLVFFMADTGAIDPSHPQRIIAAVASWQGNSWFFKMTGPTGLVAGERAGFVEFLQTVRAP